MGEEIGRERVQVVVAEIDGDEAREIGRCEAGHRLDSIVAEVQFSQVFKTGETGHVHVHDLIIGQREDLEVKGISQG